MIEVFEKLRTHVGSVCFDDGTECIWFSGIKFERKDDKIALKDMEYADYQSARIITSPDYLKRLKKIVMDADGKELKAAKRGRKELKSTGKAQKEIIIYEDFFKSRIRGCCKFELRNVNTLIRREIMSDLAKIKVTKLRPRDIAFKHSVSEYYVKKLLYEKSGGNKRPAAQKSAKKQSV